MEKKVFILALVSLISVNSIQVKADMDTIVSIPQGDTNDIVNGEPFQELKIDDFSDDDSWLENINPFSDFWNNPLFRGCRSTRNIVWSHKLAALSVAGLTALALYCYKKCNCSPEKKIKGATDNK